MNPRMVSRGFTLIELMVSLSVAAVLILACGAFVRSARDAYAQVEQGLAMDREARAVIGQLRDDLALARCHGWHADGERIAWHCLMPGSAQSPDHHQGDLCAVEYALRDLPRADGSGEVVRSLVRWQHDSRKVYQSIQRQGIDALPQRDEGDFEPLAFGVAAFSVTPLFEDPHGDWLEWRPGAEVMPTAVEVRLMLADRRLCQRLRRPGDWDEASIAADPPGCRQYRSVLRMGGGDG